MESVKPGDVTLPIKRGTVVAPIFVVVEGELPPHLSTIRSTHEEREHALANARCLAKVSNGTTPTPVRVWEVSYKADVVVRRDPPTTTDHDE